VRRSAASDDDPSFLLAAEKTVRQESFPGIIVRQFASREESEMAGGQAGVLGLIDQLWNLGTLCGMTDAQLLALFAARQEGCAEVAFEALVQRHGPMVFRVCRGILQDEHAAEDAFQATFLVLARKVQSLCVKDSLGGWLHGVAHRVATRARSDAARRRRHELRRAEAHVPAWEVTPDCPPSDAAAILSDEITRLPEKYRAPVVLCYLEEMSYRAAAVHLGVTEDTVRGRLARARERLRQRLVGRGVEIPGALAAYRLANAAPALRPRLVQATAQAALSLEAGGAASFGMISRSVVSLCERTCRTMMLTNFRTVASVMALGVIATGVLVLAQPAAGRPEPIAPAPPTHEPRRSGLGNGGNIVVDWSPADPQGRKKEIVVDPTRHCIHLPATNLKAQDRLNDCVLVASLEKGKTYTVTASGEAFMSESTGVDADPFPGVVVLYATDEEDCYAERQIILTPGKSITFRSPWNIDPTAGVSLTVFFLDTWPGHPKRGSYTLTITEAGEHADSRRTPAFVYPIKELLIPERREASKQIHVEIRRPGDVPKDRPAPGPRER
jgi:RNA polymerase sigma factor (sigma-70 family)